MENTRTPVFGLRVPAAAPTLLSCVWAKVELRWPLKRFRIGYWVKDKWKLVRHHLQLPSELSSCAHVQQWCLVELSTEHVTFDCRNTHFPLLLFLNALDLNNGPPARCGLRCFLSADLYLNLTMVLLREAQTLRRAANEPQPVSG